MPVVRWLNNTHTTTTPQRRHATVHCTVSFETALRGVYDYYSLDGVPTYARAGSSSLSTAERRRSTSLNRTQGRRGFEQNWRRVVACCARSPSSCLTPRSLVHFPGIRRCMLSPQLRGPLRGAVIHVTRGVLPTLLADAEGGVAGRHGEGDVRNRGGHIVGVPASRINNTTGWHEQEQIARFVCVCVSTLLKRWCRHADGRKTIKTRKGHRPVLRVCWRKEAVNAAGLRGIADHRALLEDGGILVGLHQTA